MSKIIPIEKNLDPSEQSLRGLRLAIIKLKEVTDKLEKSTLAKSPLARAKDKPKDTDDETT